MLDTGSKSSVRVVQEEIILSAGARNMFYQIINSCLDGWKKCLEGKHQCLLKYQKNMIEYFIMKYPFESLLFNLSISP